MAMAHSTRYEEFCDPFIAFDIFDDRNRRFRYLLTEHFLRTEGLSTAQLISYGQPMSIDIAMSRVDPNYHISIDEPDGCIWRVDRNGEVDFLTKYVRHDKKDGVYFSERTGEDPVWNISFHLKEELDMVASEKLQMRS